MKIIKMISEFLAVLTVLGFCGVIFFINFLENLFNGLGCFIGIILCFNFLIQFIIFKDDSPNIGY